MLYINFVAKWVRRRFSYLEVKMLRQTIFMAILVVDMAGVARALEGDSLWSHTYSTTPWDKAYSIIQCRDGNYLMAGETAQVGTAFSKAALVKVAPQGDQLWFQSYAQFPNDNVAYGVVEAHDGGYVFAGFTNRNDSLNEQVWICKTDTNGNALWSRTYGDESHERACNIIATSDEGYLLTCWSIGEGTWIIKTDINGDSLWSQRIDGLVAVCSIVTYDGNILTAGMNVYMSTYILKINNDGDTLWTRSYANIPMPYCMLETYSHDILLAGNMLMKINSYGDTLWTRTIVDTTFHYAVGVLESDDGGYILAGNSGDPIWEDDFMLMKTSASGEWLWSRNYDSGWGDMANSFVRGNDGNYRIAGYRHYEYRAEIWLVCAEGPSSAVEPVPMEIHPSAFILHPASPNPFNSSTVLSYQLQAPSHVSLKVFDTAGRIISTLVDDKQSAGTHESTLDGSGLVSGIYIARLEAGGFSATQKLVLLK